MEEEQTKTIHIGLTKAKKLGKSLFKYLTEDLEELSDVQQTYVLGYQDGYNALLEKTKPILEEYKQFVLNVQKRNEEMLEIIRGH